MQRTIRLAAAFCALVAAVRAAGPGDAWLRIKSANFELFTTAGERAGRDLIIHFEQVHSFFAQAMGLTGAGARPVCIIAFRSPKEYQSYRPNDFATAFFQSGFRHDHIVMSSASAEHYPAAVHEYTHLLVRQTNQAVPLWLNEGLADLFSTLQPMAGKIMVGKPVAGHLYALRSQPWIGLSAILAARADSPLYNEKSRVGMFYAESWLLVHMCNLEKWYRPRLKVMLDTVIESSADEAFEKAYGKTVAEVESDLEAYARSQSVSAVLYDLQLPKAVESPEIQTGATLAARLALAELLADGGRGHSEAEAAYRQLAADYPNRWEVEQGLGEFAMRQSLTADAVHHFARAMELRASHVELAGNQAELLLEYGRALSAAQSYRESVAVLQKALEAEPEIAEGRLELGIALVRSGSYAAALEQLTAAKGVAPEQMTRYYYHLAYAYYRLGATGQARAIIAKARPRARTAMEKEALDSLEANLDRPPAGIPTSPEPAPATAASAGAQPARQPQQHLLRRPPPDAAPPPSTAAPVPSVEGRLLAVECAGSSDGDGRTARLRVLANGRTLLFLIEDSRKVVVRGGAGGPVQFTCGPQGSRPIRVEYEPSKDTSVITGSVRALEFP